MSNIADVDVVVVGAGVVGLAAAAELARASRSVVILERHSAIALETTSRNSEVIHAGIYYPQGSLKAELCRDGREALYARCRAQRIPHRKLGKLVVASTEAEIPILERLLRSGSANGAPGMKLIDGSEVARLEPDVSGIAALVSPDSGIVDAHALCLSYLAEAEAHGASLSLRSRVVGLSLASGHWRVEVEDASGELQVIRSAGVVNAAGLASDEIARRAGMDVDQRGYRIHPCKGDYFSLAPSAPIQLSRLIYPVPARAGLGVHATLDMGGRIRFGPDAEYVDTGSLDVDPAKAGSFARAIGRYLAAIEPGMLAPDFAGLRPKLAGPGEVFRDFVIQEESGAGLPGFVNCIGIESPGLTASPAIGKRVRELLHSV